MIMRRARGYRGPGVSASHDPTAEDHLRPWRVFLLAGTVKGLVGLGLPTITIALTSLVLPLPEAIALIALPTIFTNVWQAAVGGNFGSSCAASGR